MSVPEFTSRRRDRWANPVLTRRAALGGGIASTAAAVLGCGAPDAAADPTYEGALPSPDQVDGALSRLVPGRRRAATYTMDAPAAVYGAAQPWVTIVEYSDFQCPYCGTLAKALHELVAAYPRDIRVVFRQFPLPFHRRAAPAARAALASGLQQRFWAMHDVLFAHRSRLSDEDLRGYAQRLGLDLARFDADLADPALADRVDAELARGKALGVSGTPSMFINGVFVGGMLEPAKLAEVVDGERRVAAALVDAGSTRQEVYARFMRAAGAK